MSSQQCGFCLSKDPAFLVRCVQEDCNLWFCNGNSEEESVKHRESHILSHLHMADHRKIAVCLEDKTEAVRVICHHCEEPNVFDLLEQQTTRKTATTPGVVFCRSCALADKSYNEADWKPVIDCHHDALECCVSEVFVPVSLSAECTLKFSKIQVNNEARKWIGEELGIRRIQNVYSQHVPGRKTYFKNEEEYSQHFVELERLQWLAESVECLSVPFMEDVTVFVDSSAPANSPVDVMSFVTDTEIDHKEKSFRKGANVTVYVERHGAVVPYRAFVNSMDDSDKGVDTPKRNWEVLEPKAKKNKKKAVVSPKPKPLTYVVVSFRDKPLAEEHLCGAVSVEVCSDDIAHTRRLNALARFRGSSDYLSLELKKKILGTRRQTRDRQFKQQRECKELELVGLDKDQAEAVRLALRSNLCLIKGPAGTGKTKVIITIVRHLLQKDSKDLIQILCCANSNKATDHLAVQFARALGKDKVTRIMSKSVAQEDLSEELLELTLKSRLEKKLGKNFEDKFAQQDIEQAKTEIIKSSNIICCTCNGAGCFELKRMKFETVIIDEATQASEADALIPITKGSRKVVMVGDDQQLGVAVHTKLLRTSNLTLSMFERLLSMADGSIMSCTLQTQYRMHPAIWKPLAEVIYGFEAHCTLLSARNHRAFFHKVCADGQMRNLATLAIQTSSYHEVAADGTSSLNVQEAITVAFLVLNLLSGGVSIDDIGVITFYAGQTAQIRKILLNHTCILAADIKKLAINTVDAYQAQEKQCIILSCVRSGNTKKKNGQLGFLTDQRRVNVALSRAKDALLIVGNAAYLSRYSAFWQRLWSYYPSVSYDGAMESLARCQRLTEECDCVQCSLYRGTPGDLDKLLGKMPKLIFRSVRKEGFIHPGKPVSSDDPTQEVDAVTDDAKENRQNDMALVSKFHKLSLGLRDNDLYKALGKHVLKYPQLKHCGFPLIFRKKSNVAAREQSDDRLYTAYAHQVREFQISHLLRVCDRCGKQYRVKADGSYAEKQECVYREHAGEKVYDKTNSNVYSCCRSRMRAHGCTTATSPGHVSRAYTGLNKFRSTHRVEPKEDALKHAWKMKVLALDCEMIFTEKGYEVARVSVVDRKLRKVYDSFIRPEGGVLDYITRFSGVTEKDMLSPHVKTLDEVHRDLLGHIIHKDTLLIGHSLQYDLLALRLIHMHVVDTTILYMEGTYIPSLLELAAKHLYRGMNRSDQGHDSLADARACMELAELYIVKERQAAMEQIAAPACRVRSGNMFEGMEIDVPA